MMERAELRGSSGKEHVDAAAEVEHAVFMQSYIPRTLDAVRDVEADVAKVMKGDTAGLYYAALTGMDAVGHGAAASARVKSDAHAPRSVSPADNFDASNFVGDASAVPPVSADADLPPAPVTRSDSPCCPAGRDQCDALVPRDAGGGAHIEGAQRGAEDGSKSGSDEDDDDSDDDDDEIEDGDGGGGSGSAAFTKRSASKDERKAHKALVKEEKREKRKVGSVGGSTRGHASGKLGLAS